MRRGAAARACAVAWALACKEGRRRAAAERRVVAAVWRARRRLRLQVARRRNQCRQRMRGGGWQAGARALQKQKRLVPGGFCAGRCGSPAGRLRPTGGGPPAASSSLLRAAALHTRCGRAPRNGSGSPPAPRAGGARRARRIYRVPAAPAARAPARRRTRLQPSPGTVRRQQATRTGRRGSGRQPLAASEYPRGTTAALTHAPFVLHLAHWPAHAAS
jgi:hypothetical protein